MRIALTHAFCWPEVRRGAERFIPGLAGALARRGHEVVHFSSAWEQGPEANEEVKTVCIRRRHEDDFRHEADFGRRLAPRLAAGRFDAIHSLGRRDAVAAIRASRARRGGRTVITDLGLPDPEYWRRQGRREARIVRRVVRHVDVYSCMSRCAVQMLASNYDRHDGVVVPGGVALGSFAPAAEREPNPTILFSGTIAEPRKGVPLLLEALPILARTEPDVQVWLSGPGDTAPLLRAAPLEARERTHSLGLGDVDRQHERYGRAWVTCLPSTFDSFGMALVESLACGTPIVTTTHSAPQELVDEGVTGEKCEPDDPADLAAALLRAFDLARRPETAGACRRSAKPFDWDAGVAPLCEALYRGEGPGR